MGIANARPSIEEITSKYKDTWDNKKKSINTKAKKENNREKILKVVGKIFSFCVAWLERDKCLFFSEKIGEKVVKL